MSNTFEIEDIEEKRRHLGIDDIELRERVRRLGVGDCANITLRVTAAPSAGETVTVRITGVNGQLFLGEVSARPASTSLADLRVGLPVVFSAAHIHSLPKAQQAARVKVS